MLVSPSTSEKWGLCIAITVIVKQLIRFLKQNPLS